MFCRRGRFESDDSLDIKKTDASDIQRSDRSIVVPARSSVGGMAKSGRRLRVRCALASCIALFSFALFSSVLDAQAGVGTTFPAPIGEAVDASGAVYYVSNASRNVILKATPSAGGYTETTVLTSATNFFTGNIAVDSSGDLFLIASGSLVKVTPAGGGTYTETKITSTLTTGLTVDSAGNVYGTTATGIVKLTPSGTTYTSTQILSGLNAPTGVAVDGSGNLYVTEAGYVFSQGASRVLKETLSGGAYTQSVIVDNLTETKGVAVDGKGNVYISSFHHIYKAVPSGSGYSIRLFGYFDEGAQGDMQPYWLALNAAGTTLFAEGTYFSAVFVRAYATSSVDAPGITFSSVPVGQSSTQTLTYTFAGATNLGSYRVTTQAATGLDFTDAGGGTCAAGASYAANASCTVVVKFAPRYAGTRAGSVTFVDSSGIVVEDALLSGIGTGPQMVFLAATVTKILPSISYSGIAADGNGVVYLSDDFNKRVLKETPSGSGTYTESVVASGLLGPKGIAVDGAGNLYATDYDTDVREYGVGTALKFTPLAGGGYAKTTIATGLNFSSGITVDSRGNVFIADSGASEALVRLAPLPGGGYTQTKMIGAGGCCGIAVDGSGVIYTAVRQNGVTKFTPGPLGDYTFSSFSDGNVSTTGSVAVDGSGDVYVAGRSQGDNPAVSRVKDNGDGNYALSPSAGSGIIVVDGSGSIYGIGSAYSDASGTVGGVFKADQATPPTLNFQPTAVGSVNDIPISAQLVNIGNVPLNFTVPETGTNPSISTNFQVNLTYQTDACPQLTPGSSGTSLAPGAECRAFILFAPTVAGPLTGTYTPTDDNLNVAGATQDIHLTGTGTGSGGKTTPTLVWASPAPIASGTPLGGAQLNATASVAGTFAYTPAAGTVLSPGSHILSVTFTPTDTTLYNAAAATVQILVTSEASQTLTWAPPAPIVYGTALSATQLNAVASVPGSLSYTPVAGTVLKAGTQTLSVTFTPTDTTTYKTATATVQLIVNQAVPTISWATPAAIGYGTALSATQLNATASTPGTFTYSPAAGAVPAIGTQTLSVTLTPTDSVDYTTASATVALTVRSSVLDFTFTNSGPNYTTVIPGASTSYAFALAPTSGSYPGDVSFSVTGLPAGATYTITPSTVSQSAGPQTETLRVQTAGQLAANRSRSTPGPVSAPLLAVLLIPLSVAMRRRKKIPGMPRLVVLLLGIAGLTLCGALSGCGTGNGFFGVAPKDYTITVTASSGSIQHAASVTLNLQ
jgi:sugar lactone lactonase YvrE